jgi:hypothetical protein
MRRRERDARGDGDDTGDKLRVLRCQPQRPRHRVAMGDDNGAVDLGGGQHGQQIGSHLARRIALAGVWAVGSAGPSAVGRENGESSR